MFNSRYLGFLVTCGFIIVGFMLFGVVGPIAGPLLIGAMIGSMLLNKPRLLLAVYWIAAAVNPLLQCYVSLLKWSDEGIALMMALVLVGHISTGNLKIGKHDLKIFTWFVIALLGIMGLSFIANQVSKKALLYYALGQLRFILVFYYAIIFLKPQDLKPALIIMAGILGLSVVLNLGWYTGFNPIPNYSALVDRSKGVFDDPHPMAYFSAMVTVIGLAIVRKKPPSGKLWAFGLVLAVAGLVQFAFCFATHAVIFISISGLLWLPFLVRQGGILKRSLVFLVALAVVAALDYQYEKVTSTRRRAGLLTRENLRNRIEQMWYGPKGWAYKNVVLHFAPELPYPLLGGGPANFGSVYGMKFNQALHMKYFGYFTESSYADLKYFRGHSILHTPYSGILDVWSELGPFGLILYFGLHIYAIAHVTRNLLRKKYQNSLQRPVAEAFVIVMTFWLLLQTIYDGWLLTHIPHAIWILAALVWSPIEEPGIAPANETKQVLLALDSPVTC